MNSTRLIESVFGTIWLSHKAEHKVTCSVCGKKSLWLNVQKGTCYCFVCGYKARLADIIPGFTTVHFVEKMSVERRISSELPEHNAGLPTGYTPVTLSSDFPDGWAYIKKRGVDPSTVEFGFCDNLSVVFPVRENGNVVFWQSRAISRMVKRKVNNPSREWQGIGRDEVLYQLDSINDVALIVEGCFDALVSGGIATLGKRCTEIQALKVVHKNPKIVFICYDSDAQESTERAAALFRKIKWNLPVVPVYLHTPEDPADMGRVAVWENVIETAKDYRLPQSLTSLLQRHVKQLLDSPQELGLCAAYR